MKKFEGIIVPLVTPLTSSDAVDGETLKKLIRHVIANGAAGIMPTAGTGEGVGLSMRQRRDAVEICVEEANGKYPVIPGVIVPGFGDCVDIAIEYKKIGVDGVMLLTPYFTSFGGQDTLVDYFKKFLDITEMPLMIENLPSRTGINMLPRTMLKLSEASPLFVAVKECARDAMQFSEVIYYLGNRISVLCGFESMMATAFLLGANGGVIATANLFPQIYVDLLSAAREKNVDKVNRINFDLIRPLNEAAYMTPNPGPIRYALELIGISNGVPVLPVEIPDQNVKNRVAEIITDIQKYLTK